jgi:hypothetical protein
VTFTDHGIGLCSCGVERRLYAPETQPEARWCLPCVQAWIRPQLAEPLFGTPGDARRARGMAYQLKQAAYQKQKRDRCRAAGLCWTCTKRPALEGMRQCEPCRQSSADYQRRRNMTADMTRSDR